MGALGDCIEYGIPREILIPLLPVTADFGGKGHGKAPAKFDPTTGRWGALDEWQRGGHDPNTILRDADAAGGNAGVILGAPYSGLQLLAVDIDLLDLPRAVGWRNAIVHIFQNRWNKTLLVRETWPYRALLLVNIPVDADPGAKKVFTLSFTDPKVPGSTREGIGKIEVLARGQQAAIAGMHVSGNPMQWYWMDGSDRPAPPQKFPAPPVKLNPGRANEQVSLPTFQSFDELVAAIAKILDEMGEFGFTYTILGATNTTGAVPLLPELAAPSAAEMANLINQTPNPAAVDRDIYASFMMACTGARAGLVAVRGALSQDEENLIANAVAGWAARWDAPPGHKASSIAEELSKWNDDWVRPRDENRAGWRHLLIHAQAFGAPASALTDLAMQRAQDQFQADTSRPTPASEIPGKPTLTADQITLRQSVNPNLTVTSDIAVAERLLPFFSGNAVWVPSTGSWLAWDGSAGWKSDEVTTCRVGVMVSDRLWWYVGKYGQANPAIGQSGWSGPVHDKMLSESKLNRVSNILKMHLSKSGSEINLGLLRLQTPHSMYDLTTFEKIEIMRRKTFHETRATHVEPSPEIGNTFYFDKLTLDLCDGNEEVREWLLHYIGYCLLGAPGEAVFVVIWGAGGNGKSTLVRVLQKVFGDYAVALDPQVIQESGKNMHPASINRLRNKRLALISELDKGARWNERILKMITGGDDIDGRDMGKNPTPFKSQAGVMIFSNDKPPIERADPAIRRRFRLIETVVRRADSEIIKDIGDRILKDEAASVLRKLMQYAQAVYLHGLPPVPQAMKSYANATLAENDVIYGWLQDECEFGTLATKDCEEPIEELRKRCEAYIARSQKDQGGGMVADKISARDFLDRLRREGISLDDPTNVDAQGRPMRYRRKGKNKAGVEEVIYLARGIRLKVKAVA